MQNIVRLLSLTLATPLPMARARDNDDTAQEAEDGPSEWRLNYDLAMELLAEKDYRSAEEVLTSSLQLATTDFEKMASTVYLGNALLALDQHEPALEQAIQAVRLAVNGGLEDSDTWAAMGDDGWARVAEFMQAFPWPEAGWTESGVASAGDER